MSRKFGERDGHDSGSSSAASSGPDPGKRTRTQGIVATGEGEGGGLGSLKGPLGGQGDGAVPMTDGPTKVTHETDQKAPGGAPKTRTTVGVGERVYFTAESAEHGSSWKSSAGKGTTTSATEYQWDAPATPATVTITFDPGGGGTATTVSMSVIGPNQINYSDKKEDTFGAGVAGAGMTNKLTFLPLSVCFWGTQWREKDVDGAAQGWFTHLPADKKKHKAAVPRDIGDDNSGPGDHASFSAKPPFGEKGTLSWDIPQEYSVKGANNWQQIVPPFTQLTTIETDGTLTVTKNGESVTRSP
jgi:hypothetical protein